MFLFGVAVITCTLYFGCGVGPSSQSAPQATQPGVAGSPGGATAPHHIFVIAEENDSYGSVVGNTSQMPYLNSLISKGTLWTNYYANQHGSMNAYIETLSGTNFDCTGNDCGASGALTGPSLMDVMNTNGMPWKGYFDGLSTCGQLAPQSTNWILNPDSNGKENYYQRHAGFPWYAVGTATIATCQFTTDLDNRSFGNFNWITPDGSHDGHDGTPQQLDAFMQKWLTPLLASSYFQPGGDGILIIWWDEADLDDAGCGGPNGTSCGGRIPMTVIGPGIKPNNQDATPANHDSVSRFIQQQLGLTPTLGNSVNVPDFTNTLE
jgi:acid phosphatase